MRTPASLVISPASVLASWALLAALAGASGCGGGSGQANISGEQPVGTPLLPEEGDYVCRFDDGGAGGMDPPVACRVTRSGQNEGQRMLITVGTLDRIRGTLTPVDHRSFRLEGIYVCPQEACTDPANTVFEVVEAGIFRAPLATSQGVLWVTIEQSSGAIF